MQEVEAEYCIANGKDHDAEVIYGDTDSVMVKFGPQDLATVMALGAEAADLVTMKFVKPIKLEFEKVYFPYLLINKKRYAGLYWTKTEKYDKMDSKGIEVRFPRVFSEPGVERRYVQTVRRDNCRLVSTVIETCLHKMLIDRDVRGAEESVADLPSRSNRCLDKAVQIHEASHQRLVAKQNRHVTIGDYEGAREGRLCRKTGTRRSGRAHEAARCRSVLRVNFRGYGRLLSSGSAPALGDRVAYVVIKGIKSMFRFVR